MRIKGKEINQLNVELVVIPRPDGDIVFKCQAVLDYTEFEKLCPQPKPPTIYGEKGGKKEGRPDFKDKDFLKKFNKWIDQRECWMVYQSLKATEDLEWSQVRELDPETWPLINDEFKNAKFTVPEVNRLRNAIEAANGLDEARIEEARNSFLRSQAEEKVES